MFDIFYTGTQPNLFPHERQVDSIEQAQEQSRTRYFWWINYLSDYSGFDFLWEPVPWESDQMHVWPSQHQANGGTALVPRRYKHVNRSHPVVPRRIGVPRLHIKHTPSSEDLGDVNVRYVSDYLGTMRRALSKVKWEYCWVTSDVCNYANFDFSWHPSEWQQDMLHVFASNEQKFGDTFYVHVPSFLAKIKSLKVLEWFETLNFIEDRLVPRLPMPQVKYTDDSLVTAVWNHEFETPLVEFYQTVPLHNVPTISLWQERTKTVVPLSQGNATAVVPRECKNYIKTQIYDYPYIDKTKRVEADCSMDVVFISNGEPMAEENWQNLLTLCPRAKRSDGVNGREAAYKAAAKLSNTAWFFAVFAKTEVLADFKFDFQPDRFQEPKHYIFHSRNPLNGLEYGAMNINLYNRQLTLDTVPGLDFTLSSAHAVIPIVASVSRFNTDPWVTWRSAFREVLKLKREVDLGADVEIQHRLHVWCERAVGDNAEYCLAGANDALEYYAQTNGDYAALCLSFDWAWLKQYYYTRYQQQPWLESI